MEHVEYVKMAKVEQNHWWFVAKRKILGIALKRNHVQSHVRVLDVGCGTGAVLEFLSRQNYVAEGVDISPIAVDFCIKKGLQATVGDATRLPFASQTFDVVCALDILEHVTQPEKMINEISRILKPGGLLIATVPAHQFLFSYHDRALHHVKRYNTHDLKKEVSAHLQVVDCSWIHCGILMPAIIHRFVGSVYMKESNRGSDITHVRWITNMLMGCVYSLELGFFRLFGRMPWGLSLIVIGRRN